MTAPALAVNDYDFELTFGEAVAFLEIAPTIRLTRKRARFSADKRDQADEREAEQTAALTAAPRKGGLQIQNLVNLTEEVQMSEQTRNLSYGDYILRTGRGIIGEYELVFGAFFYQKFEGRSRIVDIGPGRCWFPKQNPQCILAVDNSPELVAH